MRSEASSLRQRAAAWRAVGQSALKQLAASWRAVGQGALKQRAAARRAVGQKENQGFTLVEMLVALAVFGLAALALLNLAGENTRSAARVETRTFGGVVADNLGAQALVAVNAPEGDSDGVAHLAGRDWRWTQSVAATDDPDILRIDIQVRDSEGLAAERVYFRARRS